MSEKKNKKKECQKFSLGDDLNKSMFVEVSVSGLELIEDGVDSLLSNPILSAIPIVKTFKTLVIGVLAFKERFLIKKLILFLYGTQEGIDVSKEREKFKKMLDTGKWTAKDSERLINILDRQSEIEKAFYVRNLFEALVDDEIRHEEFLDYTELIDKVFYSDLKTLENEWRNLDKNGILLVNKQKDKSISRLETLGLGNLVYLQDSGYAKVDYHNDKYFMYDEYSQKFINIIFGQRNGIKENNVEFTTKDNQFEGTLILDGGNAKGEKSNG